MGSRAARAVVVMGRPWERGPLARPRRGTTAAAWRPTGPGAGAAGPRGHARLMLQAPRLVPTRGQQRIDPTAVRGSPAIEEQIVERCGRARPIRQLVGVLALRCRDARL